MIAHKRNRQVNVGPNTMWLFEDRLTVQYQVQEMLRTERIFEAEGIAEELAAYNPLIPDGTQLESHVPHRVPGSGSAPRAARDACRGVEDRCWVQVAGCERVFAIADEDLERENEAKTSAVHFLRFELSERDGREAQGWRRACPSASTTLTISTRSRPRPRTCAPRWSPTWLMR